MKLYIVENHKKLILNVENAKKFIKILLVNFLIEIFLYRKEAKFLEFVS